MFRILKGLTLLVLCTTVVSAQSSTKKPIEGAWKVTEIVVTGTDASNVANPQPGLIIFARKHYSIMWVPGNQPRSLFKGEDPTNEEKIAAYDSFVANSGTYEVAGATLTLHPMVARSPKLHGRRSIEIPTADRGSNTVAHPEKHGPQSSHREPRCAI